MKHIHLFRHIGGGCAIKREYTANPILPCDDHYRCECGAEFKAYSEQEVHFQMPQYIAGKDEPEPIEVNITNP